MSIVNIRSANRYQLPNSSYGITFDDASIVRVVNTSSGGQTIDVYDGTTRIQRIPVAGYEVNYVRKNPSHTMRSLGTSLYGTSVSLEG